MKYMLEFLMKTADKKFPNLEQQCLQKNISCEKRFACIWNENASSMSSKTASVVPVEFLETRGDLVGCLRKVFEKFS